MKVSSALLVLIIPSTFSGCANWDSIYRTHTFDLEQKVSKSAIVDAKQREIIAANNTICPGPPSDVMAAYALELAGRADLPEKVRAEIVMAAQSSAAYIGVRSRNIQFSRDQVYSLCIDRMNDTVDDGQYNFYKSRLARYQMATAAIEQLTDPAISPPVVIGSSGSATAYGNIIADQEKLQAARVEKQKIEKNGGPKSDGQNLTDEEKVKIKELEKSIVDLENKMRSTAALAVSGNSGGTAPGVTSRQTGPSKEVVEAVKRIAISTLLTDDSVLLCVERIINLENQISGAQLQYCNGVLAGNSTPLMKLHPDLLKWITE